MALKQPQGEMWFQWPARRATEASPQAPSTPTASPFRRAAWWGSYLATWCIVLALAACVALRFFEFDATYIFTCLNSFTRYLYLPAYMCVAWAAWQRRWILLAVGLVI